MSAAAAVVETAKEAVSGPKEVAKGLMTKPVIMLSIILTGLILVLVLEAFKPGLITGPLRAGLRKLGLKGA
jgi:hypothetical protein